MQHKLTILAAVATIAALIAVCPCPHDKKPVVDPKPVDYWVFDLFKHWVEKHGKLYGSEDEKSYRLHVFSDNVMKIQRNREAGKSYTLAINKFSDLTGEEFKARYLTLKVENKKTYNTVLLNTTNAPAAVDWRTQGLVAPVKDQGQCGSCWAFSAIAALEGLAAQKTGKIETFSEQQLVDCAGAQGNQGCNGGLMDSAFEYVELKGIETEAAYPYKATDQKCKAKGAAAFKNVAHADVGASDNDQLLAASAQRVVSVAIEADTDIFQSYSTGVINDASCGTQLDHGVTLVGYGSEAGQDYWIVRNSWGGDWGEQGYLRIARDAGKGDGICGIAMMASYPTA